MMQQSKEWFEKVFKPRTKEAARAREDAIKAMEENRQLKNRCFVLSNGAMCFFCPLECEHRTAIFRKGRNPITGKEEK